ncbi:MAG: DUF4126 domain-containing protein [Chloroflexi bacterium]|nr:DUF4126 domain-containing protein [Chloroflexota bacterium]
MITAISQLLTGLGLSSASGLNAYIPLLIVALTARFTPLFKLNPPFDLLANEWVIGALVVLLAIEMIVDKIPAADTINDLIQTFIRPAAGAILFAASASAISELNPIFAAILGLILAFSVHATKSAARPIVTATTAGLGNAFVSVGEDLIATGVSLAAIIAPVCIGVFLLPVILFIAWRFAGRREKSSAAG